MQGACTGLRDLTFANGDGFPQHGKTLFKVRSCRATLGSGAVSIAYQLCRESCEMRLASDTGFKVFACCQVSEVTLHALYAYSP